jgi:hypothetical protein
VTEKLDFHLDMARVGWWWRTANGRRGWALTFRRAERAAARAGSWAAQAIIEARRQYR